MSSPDHSSFLSLDAAINQLRTRERRVAEFRIAAGQLCLSLAQASGSLELISDMQNHWAVAPTDQSNSRRGHNKDYGFWLRGSKELRFAENIIAPPTAITLTVATTPSGFSRQNDAVLLALHAEPEQQRLRLEFETFSDEPMWWFDGALVGENAHAQLSINEDGMQPYSAYNQSGTHMLQKASEAILTSLNAATWEEALNVDGDLY